LQCGQCICLGIEGGVGEEIILWSVGTQTTAWEIGKHFAGKTFVDALGYRQQEVVIDENGWAEFHCNAGSVSVWVLKVG